MSAGLTTHQRQLIQSLAKGWRLVYVKGSNVLMKGNKAGETIRSSTIERLLELELIERGRDGWTASEAGKREAGIE